MRSMSEMRRRIEDPATRQEAIIEVADWMRDIALLYDAQLETAYRLALTMASGLDKSWREADQP